VTPEREVRDALPPHKHEEFWRDPRVELLEDWPEGYTPTQQILAHQLVARMKEIKRTRANLGRLLAMFGPNPFQPKNKRALQAAYDADEAAWDSCRETLVKLDDEGYSIDPQRFEVALKVIDPEGLS